MAPITHRRVDAAARFGTQGSTTYLELTGRSVNRSKPPVLWCHGWPDAATALANLSANLNWGTSSLLAAGYAVWLPFTGSNWGHATAIFPTGTGGTAQQAIADTVTAAVAAGHPAGKVHLVGLSMGACNALNWAWRNPASLGGLQLFVPVHDLPAMWDQVTYRPSLNGVYGTANRAAFVTASAANDPIRNQAAIAALAPRVQCYAAPDDTVINWATLVPFCATNGIPLTSSDPGTGGGGGGHVFWNLTDAYDEFQIVRHFAACEALP